MTKEFNVGTGSYKVHYGETDDPRSVKCGNGKPNFDHLSWSDERPYVTCKTCLNRLALPDATPGSQP